MNTNKNLFQLNLNISFLNNNRHLYAFMLLFILQVLSYSNSFNSSWLFDDYPNIIDNPYVHINSFSWDEIKKPLSLSRPLSYFSFSINYYFGKFDVYHYHLTNFLIHYLTSIFLFCFISRTLQLPVFNKEYDYDYYSITLLASSLWATSPINAPAVSIIVQRMASMAGLFYIISMYCFLRARTTDNKKYFHIFLLLSIIAAFLAFSSKQNAIVLPISFFLYDLMFLHNEGRRNVLLSNKYIYAFIIISLLVVIIFHSYFASIFDGYRLRPYTMYERLLTEPRVIVFYLSLIIYPASNRFALLHDIDISTSIISPLTTLPAILFLFFLVYLSYILTKRYPLAAFSLIFFLINHIIEGTIIPLEVVFEHRNYIPSMFLFLPLVLALRAFTRSESTSTTLKYSALFTITIFLAAQAHTTYMRNFTFRTPLSLWTDNVKKAPNLSIVHNNLGREYYEHGFYQEAYDEFTQAIYLNRYNNFEQRGLPYHNLALMMLEKGKLSEALINARKAIELSPNNIRMRSMFIRILLRDGNYEAACASLTEALRKWPGSASLRSTLAILYILTEKYDEAIMETEKALYLGDLSPDPYALLGESYRMKGECWKALKYWKEYMEKSNGGNKARLALIEIYGKLGDQSNVNKTLSEFIKYTENLNETSLYNQVNSGEVFFYKPDIASIKQIIGKPMSMYFK